MTWIHTSKGSIIKSKTMKHIILAFCHIIFLLAGKGVLGEVCPAESENGATLGELGPIADASTFVSLAQTADILSILDSTSEVEQYHIFAPSDEALAVYLEEYPDVGTNEEQALSLLTYHIVEIESCEPLNGNGYATLLEGDGQTLDVSEDSVVDPNGYSARIIASYPLKNGYLYVIDDILTPLFSK
jgi:uncharacterized surface protein with fasciclin (FAS1) repeats